MDRTGVRDYEALGTPPGKAQLLPSSGISISQLFPTQVRASCGLEVPDLLEGSPARLGVAAACRALYVLLQCASNAGRVAVWTDGKIIVLFEAKKKKKKKAGSAKNRPRGGSAGARSESRAR